MKYSFNCPVRTLVVFICLLLLFSIPIAAQPAGCVYKDPPLIQIDFGNAAAREDINLSQLRRYDYVEGSCPNDGEYGFAAYTADCFSGHWHTLPADHTPGDAEGRMMLVNAAERPGVFFMLNIDGLKPNSTYEFAAWIVNICRAGFECTTIPPLLKVSIICQGRLVRSFTTGEINPVPDPQWKRYSAPFTLPADASAITLQIENENPGGCGNDFALDDISLRECVLPQPPVVKTLPQEPQRGQKEKDIPVQAKKPVVIAEDNQEPLPVKRSTVAQPAPIRTPDTKELPRTVALPSVIATRANPVLKQITTEAAELLIELYDNGQIDGDTVSIFHNNELIKSRAALSEKPVVIKLNVDREHPHHELIMVAENLGSIPPNTSLMIITAKRKRYEVFISSSEQKNAKIVIDLKE